MRSCPAESEVFIEEERRIVYRVTLAPPNILVESQAHWHRHENNNSHFADLIHGSIKFH
jgi:hypothetical protein